MGWKQDLKKNIQKKLKDAGSQRPKEINAHLELISFEPKPGWWAESIPVKLTIINAGNCPTHNAVVAIYAGRTGINFSEFVFISNSIHTIYPGQEITINEKPIEQKLLPFSGPTLPLPGSPKAILIAICFDPFLTPFNLLEVDETTISTHDFLSGGYYSNNAVQQPTGERLFGYTEII